MTDLAGVSVTWRGKQYRALVADPSAMAELETGGFTLDGDFTLKIPRSELGASIPSINDQIAMDGAIYRVVENRQKPGSAFVILVISAS